MKKTRHQARMHSRFFVDWDALERSLASDEDQELHRITRIVRVMEEMDRPELERVFRFLKSRFLIP